MFLLIETAVKAGPAGTPRIVEQGITGMGAIGTAMNMVKPPPFGIGKTAPVFRGATEPKVQRKLEQGLTADTFTRSEKTATATKPSVNLTAATIKTLLSGDDRKHNAAEFFKAVTGIQLPGSKIDMEKSAERQARIQATADAIRQMAPAEKVELMRKLCGPDAPGSRIAESVLINHQAPKLNDLFDAARPRTKSPSSEGISAGIQAVGMGLLMLPVIAPAGMLLKPDLFGQVLGVLGLMMV